MLECHIEQVVQNWKPLAKDSQKINRREGNDNEGREVGGWEKGTMFQETRCNEGGGGEADRSNS